MNNSWHPDCFCCDICQAVLADVGFVKNAGRSVPLQPVTIIPPSSFSLSLPLGRMIMSMMLFYLVLMFFYKLLCTTVMHSLIISTSVVLHRKRSVIVLCRGKDPWRACYLFMYSYYLSFYVVFLSFSPIRHLCRPCHNREKARGLGKYICQKCHAIIEEQPLLFKNDPYHPDHFNCNNCG